MTKECIIPGCKNPPKGTRGMAGEVCLRHYEVEKKRRQKARRLEELKEYEEYRNETIREIDDQTLIDELERRGDYIFTPKSDVSSRKVINLEQYRGQKTRIGVVSDFHGCSPWQQLTHLTTTYQRFYEREIELVLNLGDLSDGSPKMHVGQDYKLIITSSTAQKDCISETYPDVGGIKTIVIPGNHDESWEKHAGYNIVKEVCAVRPDMEYMPNGSTVTINGIDIYLIHPAGGLPYAISYRGQKVSEQIAPEHKPHILLIGHLHKPNHTPAYRNIECFTLPCFQAQTPFLTGKGLFPTIGGLILEFESNETGLVSVSTEWLIYYVPVENDFGFGEMYYIGNRRITKEETPQTPTRQSKDREVS